MADRVPAETVLVVGLSDAHREGLAIILRGEGFAVMTAAHSHDALRLLADEFRPGIVLLDLMTPVMDGFQFLSRRREDPVLAATPVILLTERAGTEAAWVQALGADGYIPKPLDVDDVLRIVRGYVASSEQHSQRRNAKQIRAHRSKSASDPSDTGAGSTAVGGQSRSPLHRSA